MLEGLPTLGDPICDLIDAQDRAEAEGFQPTEVWIGATWWQANRDKINPRWLTEMMRHRMLNGLRLLVAPDFVADFEFVWPDKHWSLPRHYPV